MRINPLWTVLLLFGLVFLPRSSWAQGGIAVNSSFVGRPSELTLSTATSGAVGGALLEPIAGGLPLTAPHGFGTMRPHQWRGSVPTKGLTIEFADVRPPALDFMERSGGVPANRQLQPTKLKKMTRRARSV